MEGMELEAVKVEVRKNMAQLNVAELTTLASELSVTVPPAKMGKLSGIFNVVSMHLMAQEDEDDDGKAVFEHASSILNRVLGARPKPDVEVKPKEVSGDQTADASSTTVSVETGMVQTVVAADVSGRLQGSAPSAQNNGNSSHSSTGSLSSTGMRPVPYQRLRDFRITGGSVGCEDSAVDLTSVLFQMEEGRQVGYTEREVRSGVINAMKAGYTRKYFQRNIDTLSVNDFKAMLEELYGKKESSDLLDEMAESVQGPKQKEKEYIVQMFELRDHIREVTQSEEEPLGEAFVQKKMIRAISVGLRRDTVRLEMKSVLKDPQISDRNLLKELNEIVARDEENRKKMDKGGGRNANVNSLQQSHDSRDEKDTKLKPETTPKPSDTQLNRIETQLGQLSVTMVELAAGKADVEERLKRLEGKFLENEKRAAGFAGNRYAEFPRCEACAPDRKHCTHCAKCGESGHKRKECPKNC